MLKISPIFTRNMSTFGSVYSSFNLKAKEQPQKWNLLINEAEKTVGYPTSFLSLRWILNDEVANIANHIRKLIGTNHPILKTTKKLLLNKDLTWGLIVLLIAKTAGLNSKFPELEHDRTAGILHSQRIVAEITEMIKTGNLIHKGLLNIDPASEDIQDLHFGNKLALLVGDYLFSKSFTESALIRNTEVQELVAVSLRNLSEAEFIGLRDKQNQPIPSKPLLNQNFNEIIEKIDYFDPFPIENVMGNMKSEWVLRNLLNGATLLAYCCQSVIILGNHDKSVQQLAFEFGKNFALAWQAKLDIDLFKKSHFSLVSAPIMLHLEYNPSFYREIEKGMNDVNDVDYELVRKVVSTGPALEKSYNLQQEFSRKALDVLANFSNSDSKNALINIVTSL